MGRYLVTGGAGFVGSHLVAALLARGDDCVVIDNFYTGHRRAVLMPATLVEGDIGDASLLDRVMDSGPWDAVFHFAALSLVGESMREPVRYFAENVGKGSTLIDACVRHNVKRFVLSSTASLFGERAENPIGETAPIAPANPYGDCKWTLERVLGWADKCHGMRNACLRYFNAAGADPEGRLGEDHRPETHLIPLVIDAALGRRPALDVFGNDFPTPDGTCVRDYVHVSDLAQAHLAALSRLDHGSVAYNLGTGHGHSVLEVIRAVERVSGRAVPHRIVGRRAGDPPVLVASSTLIEREAGWKPRFQSLDDIVATALAWRERHPNGYDS